MEMDAPQPLIDFAVLGKRLSRLREVRGWTLDELAIRSGLSLSYLSRVESGERQPSLGTLSVLAQVYGVSLGSLFEPEAYTCIVIRGADNPPQPGNDLFYARLSRYSPHITMQAIRVTVNPHSTTVYAHPGEEWLYVLSGRLHLAVGEEKHILEVGDAAHFFGNTPHRFSSAIEQITEVLIVASATNYPLLLNYF